MSKLNMNVAINRRCWCFGKDKSHPWRKRVSRSLEVIAPGTLNVQRLEALNSRRLDVDMQAHRFYGLALGGADLASVRPNLQGISTFKQPWHPK